VLSAISAKSIGTPQDKLRLFLLYYMTTDVSNEDMQRFEEALQESGADISALHYLKKYTSLPLLKSLSVTNPSIIRA